jgi:uncharacterized protein YdeI (YjbR/CyaY-like superfamily)
MLAKRQQESRMAQITITETLTAQDRAAWRAWLTRHHADKTEIWLLLPRFEKRASGLLYLEAVEEALCFGWIDGISKTFDETRRAQRFTPRRPKSNWTELNKDRARRLIAAGLMTPAGAAVLPDLDTSAFRIADDIEAALKRDAQTWSNFEAFPDSYKRIRIGFIEEMRKQPDEFDKRLNNFLHKTKQNKQFGILE